MTTNRLLNVFRAIAILSVAALLAVLVLANSGKADAAVTHVRPASTTVRHQHVVYADNVNPVILYVELNDGSRYFATPCKYEDSVNCWWDASSEGNGRGHSFIAFAKRGGPVTVLYLNRKYGLAHDHVVGDGPHDNDGAVE